MGPFESPRRKENLTGMVTQCFTRYKPDFLPNRLMAMSENLCLIIGRNLIPFSNVIEFACLVRLRAFLVVETKKATQWLRQAIRKHVKSCSSISAMKKTSLGEAF